MAKRSRSHDSLKTTRSVLEGILNNLGIANKIEQHRIWAVWQEAVGVQIAQHAVPARIRNNVLEVKVAHPVWMQQLQLLKPRLLVQINSHLGDTPITDLYLRRGQIKVETHTPREPEIALPELDSAELNSIHRLTEQIQDDGVRTALEELFAKHRRLEKRAKLERDRSKPNT
jgi:predicted nucleic acid-binding Zn ribbon protein